MKRMRLKLLVRLLLEHVVEEHGDLLVDLIKTTNLEQVVLMQLGLMFLLQVLEVAVQLVVPGKEYCRLEDQRRGRDEEVHDGEVLEVGRARDHARN